MKINNKVVLGIVIAVLLIVVGVVAGYYVFNNQTQGTATSTTSSATQTATSSSAQDQKSVTRIDDIVWNEPQVLPGDLDLMGNKLEQKYYEVGTIKSGKYKDGKIILAIVWYNDGPMPYPAFFHLIKQDDNYLLLQSRTSEMDPASFGPALTINTDYDLPQLDFPKTLPIPRSKSTLELDVYAASLFSADNLKKAFTDPNWGDVYTSAVQDPTNKDLSKRNGFYLRAPDGTVRVYSLKPDFVVAGQAPKITWSDGTSNTADYSYTDHTGCGSANYAAVMSEDKVKAGDLKIVGKTASGDNVFELKDQNNQFLKDLYDKEYQVWSPDNSVKKVPYEEFVASHPLFFWRDSFGRLIKFRNIKFGPSAECGKPVIYLYPKQTEKVSVQVTPQGGMTYSDPLYKNGWLVTAKPNGELTEVSSGSNYPYLFWEGRGGIYQQPTKGFVIKQSEVHSFLIDKLAQLGLNSKETADFIEFWEPRMQSAPFYFVTFLGNREMDRIAPLTISPKPDTVVRVLMDFSPLSAPTPVAGYEIKTPERKGFTVIEWGGVIR